MLFKSLLGLVFSLFIASNVMAQSSLVSELAMPSVQSQTSQAAPARVRPPREPRPRAARAVPELNGSMAALAFGLIFAVGALVREKRRQS